MARNCNSRFQTTLKTSNEYLSKETFHSNGLNVAMMIIYFGCWAAISAFTQTGSTWEMIRNETRHEETLCNSTVLPHKKNNIYQNKFIFIRVFEIQPRFILYFDITTRTQTLFFLEQNNPLNENTMRNCGLIALRIT